MKLFKFIFFLSITILFFACKSPQQTEQVSTTSSDCNYKKIKFDVFALDARGQIGTDNNKTALDFEFCIPDSAELISEIMNIDTSLKSQKGKGRSNCSENQLLIMGTTYNKDYKKILCKLSQLAYIKEINQTFWE